MFNKSREIVSRKYLSNCSKLREYVHTSPTISKLPEFLCLRSICALYNVSSQNYLTDHQNDLRALRPCFTDRLKCFDLSSCSAMCLRDQPVREFCFAAPLRWNETRACLPLILYICGVLAAELLVAFPISVEFCTSSSCRQESLDASGQNT